MSEEIINKLATKLENLQLKVENFQKIIESKDNQIQILSERNKELSNKLISVSNERINSEEKCVQLLEELSKIKDQKFSFEKEALQQKMEYEAKIKKLIESKKRSSDSQMGASLELDKVVQELDEANKKIAQYESKILSLTRGKTGLIMNKEDLIRLMKDWLISARRSVRIVVPTVRDLEENGLTELLNAQAESTQISIATDLTGAESLVDEWKNKGWTVVDFNEKNLWVLNIDGGQVMMTVAKKNEYNGIFSDIPEFIELFKNAMMHPFIKGKK